MALYEFFCEKCGRFETSRHYDEIGDVRCPSCKGKVRRVFSPFSFSFGWTLSDESRWVKGKKDELVRNI